MFRLNVCYCKQQIIKRTNRQWYWQLSVTVTFNVFVCEIFFYFLSLIHVHSFEELSEDNFL